MSISVHFSSTISRILQYLSSEGQSVQRFLGLFFLRVNPHEGLNQFVLLLWLQTGRRRRLRRDESSCCWMSWSYWSTNGTRWCGTWTPRRKSKSPTEPHIRPTAFCWSCRLLSVWECVLCGFVQPHPDSSPQKHTAG